MINPNLAQSNFRFRNDDGSETAATWRATAGTNISLAPAVRFRLRIEVRETAGAAKSSSGPLRYSLNGGAYTNITTSSAVVRAVTSSNVADGAATTEQLAGPGTFVAGSIDSNGTFATPSLNAQDTEMEFVLELVSGGVADGDTVDFQINGLDTYTVTPRVTATVSNEITLAATEGIDVLDASVTAVVTTATADLAATEGIDVLDISGAGGPEDILWIATRSADRDIPASAPPADFINMQSQAGASLAAASTNTAERSLNAASVDPGPFTSTNEEWVSWTLAVLPTGGTPFPVVEARATGASGGSGTTTHPVTLPSGIVAGELLVVVFSSDGAPDITVNTGVSGTNWNKLGQASEGILATGAIFWKIAEGSDALTLTTSVGEQSSHVTLRITGSTTIEGTSATGASIDSDPPNHTASVGAGGGAGVEVFTPVTLDATEGIDTADIGVSLPSAVAEISFAATEGIDTAALALEARTELDLAATEGLDTAALDAQVYTTATLAATESLDTAALGADVYTPVTLAATEGIDAADIALEARTEATLAATEGIDTAALSADSYTGLTLAATEGIDTAALSAGVHTPATLAATEGIDTAALALEARTELTLDATEGPDTLAASVTVVAAATADLAATEGFDAAALAADVYTASTLAATEGIDTAALDAGVYTPVTLAATEGADAAALDAEVYTGLTLAATEGLDTADIALEIRDELTLAATEGIDTADIGVSLPGAIAEMSLAATEGVDTAALDADVYTPVTLAATEGIDTATLDAGVYTPVTLAATEGVDTADLDADVYTVTTLAATEGPDALAASVTAVVAAATADLAATEGIDTADIDLAASTVITLAATEGTDTAALAAEIYIAVTLAATEGIDTAAIDTAAIGMVAEYFANPRFHAICDRCGAQYKASQLRIEWNGLRTCSGTGTRDCWEHRHPQDSVRGRKDNQTPPWVRPVPSPVDVSPGSGNEVNVGGL